MSDITPKPIFGFVEELGITVKIEDNKFSYNFDYVNHRVLL